MIPAHKNKEEPPKKPSQLFTLPFYILYVFLFLYWGIYMRTFEFSRATEWNTKSTYFPRLEQGWIPGRKMDLSDDQWKGFRGYFPFLILLMIVYAFVTDFIKKNLCKASKNALLLFYSISPMIVLYFCFGYTLIFPVLIALTIFGISRVFGGSRWNPILSWVLILFVIFTTELYRGWRFEDILGQRYAWMDSHRGFLSWNVYFKVTICRLISFNVDYYHNFHHKGIESIPNFESFSDYRKRQEAKRPLSSYSFLMFWSYIFYLPLYLAGPISFFNSWASYLEKPQDEWDTWKKATEAIKLIIYFLLYEILSHYTYVSAVMMNRLWSDRFSGYWTSIGMNPLSCQELFILCCHVCIFWWLKFLIIWRTFRIWAILDGVYVPDNMSRCLYNVTFFKQFWRTWHITFYQWALRYIYLPLGGEKTKYWNIWLLYSFIAIWHDLWWRWFLWAIFNCFCIVTEAILFWWLNKPNVAKVLNKTPWLTYFVELTIRAFGIQMLAICQQSVNVGNDIFELIKIVYWSPGSWICFLTYALPAGLFLAIFQVEFDRTYGSTDKVTK